MVSSSERTTQTPTKKELASQKMREKIFSTTIEIIGTEGYGEVTANNLSKKAGISKGALYHHFNNLDEIRVQALAVLIGQFMETDDPGRFDDLEDFLKSTGEITFMAMDQYPVAIKALYNYIIQAFFDDNLKEQLKTLVNHALKQYEEALLYFCPDLDEKELTGLVQIIDTYMGGVTLQGYILDDQKSRLANWDQFSKMLIQYIRQLEKS